MSTTSVQTNITLVNSEANLLLLLDSISNLPVEPPSLYIDLKGDNLGRLGSITVFSMHIAPSHTTYLLDIHSLGNAAFSTSNAHGTSLKTVLESLTIPKVFFDIRNASDALFALFKISVNNVKDLQLMELACRKGSRKFVSSLAKCIENESQISEGAKAQWRLARARGPRLFDGAGSSCYRVFDERPWTPEIVQYFNQDVVLLPGLYNAYNGKLSQPGEAFWRVQVRESTKSRIKLSQSLNYDGKSKHNAVGWSDEEIEDDLESWNEDIMMEIAAGQCVLNEHDDWVRRADDDFDDLPEVEEEELLHSIYDDHYDSDKDTARDCIGWEEDMAKNGESF